MQRELQRQKRKPRRADRKQTKRDSDRDSDVRRSLVELRCNADVSAVDRQAQ